MSTTNDVKARRFRIKTTDGRAHDSDVTVISAEDAIAYAKAALLSDCFVVDGRVVFRTEHVVWVSVIDNY